MSRRSLWIGALLPSAFIGSALCAWSLSPTLRERTALLGLVSGIPVLQAEAARSLADHPTRASALALVAFVNWAYQPPIDLRPAARVLADPEEASPDTRQWTSELLEKWGCVSEPPRAPMTELSRQTRAELLGCLEAEVEAREPARQARVKLAGRGFRSLCALTGHDFSTRCAPRNGTASWGTLSDPAWSRSLGTLNGWAIETFGPELLASAMGSRQG